MAGRDAPFIFLFLAQLAEQGSDPCPSVGADIGFLWADVDCDDDIDDEDAIAILMCLAGLEPEQNDPCLEIGDAFSV